MPAVRLDKGRASGAATRHRCVGGRQRSGGYGLESDCGDSRKMIANRPTREQAVEVLVAAEPEIRALGIERLALFGSVLRGEAQPDSDIDLLVQFSQGAKTFDRFLTLCELLEQRLGWPVDLVTTEALSPFIGPHILAEAQDVLRAS